MDPTNVAELARLNDEARSTFSGCRVVVTPGIAALGKDQEILALVRTFSNFSPNNDPFGEHDFGAFEFAGHTIFWKIDCYDIDMSMASPDPADPTVTVRVLTVMLGEEY